MVRLIIAEVKRATLEYVQKRQDEFIFGETGIDVLAEKEETVDPKTRNIFFENLAFSLLGKGLDYSVELNFENNVYDLGSVSVFARKMAYFTDTSDKKQELMLKSKKVRVPIKLLWIALREAMYKPMDEALTLALKSSAEIFSGGSDSYSVDFDESKQ